MTAKKKKNVVGVNSRQQVEKATVNTHLAGFLSNEEKTFLGGKKKPKRHLAIGKQVVAQTRHGGMYARTLERRSISR